MSDIVFVPPSRTELRASVARAELRHGPVLGFGVPEIDSQLAQGGLACHALHEVAASSESLNDDAAATMFLAGITARLASNSDSASSAKVLWALTDFDLFAPGLERAGLRASAVFHAQASDDAQVLALVEDAARHGSCAAIVGEVRRVGMTASRRLQLAAAQGKTPVLLLRRWKRANQCPLKDPSAVTTRWRIGSAPSVPLGVPGIGRACWSVELVRQRGGPSFSVIMEACDEAGRLAPTAVVRDRAAASAELLTIAA